MQAAIQAREAIEELRRSPREYLVARRCPGDVVGEMEALRGAGARRSATVVAASPAVKVARVPYALAKGYLARHPLVSRCPGAGPGLGWVGGCCW